jgi:hypothetical protein
MARTTRRRRTEGVAHAWRKVAMPHLAGVGEGLGLPELDSPFLKLYVVTSHSRLVEHVSM